MSSHPPPSEDQDWDYYIESLIRYGRRQFTADEERALRKRREVLANHQRTGWVLISIGVASLVLSIILLTVYRQYEWAAVSAFGFLALGLIGSSITYGSKKLATLLERELQFGQIDAYGAPPEFNQRRGLYPWIEVIRYSPITKRALWVQDKFVETQYYSPTQVAKAPPEYQNLVESGWLSESSELHRMLSEDEAKELQHHLSVRKGQAVMGIFALVGLLGIAALLGVTRRYVTGMIYGGIILVPLVITGWRAWVQAKALRRALDSKQLAIVRHRNDDGSEVTFEVLEASGTLWTAEGVAAPWRGRRGAG